MYVTAHKVVSHKDEKGINSFFHKHDDHELSAVNWSSPEVVLLADKNPGQLVRASYELPPGGNRVLSYLDVFAPNGTEEATVRLALEELQKMLSNLDPPLARNIDGIGIRFSTITRLRDRRAEEFEELKQRLLAMYEDADAQPSVSGDPLEVDVSWDGTFYYFSLRPSSKVRVQEMHEHGSLWHPGRVRMTNDTLLDFQEQYGEIWPHVISMLTSLPLDAVVDSGGVRFFRSDREGIWREWPATRYSDLG